MTTLLEDLLEMPVGPMLPAKPRQADLTREIVVTDNTVTATLVDDPGCVNEGTALEFLQAEGLTPEEWEVSSFRKSAWGDTDNPKESVSFTFKRSRVAESEGKLDLDELLPAIQAHSATRKSRPEGEYGAIVALGDMQFGKIDGDGITGTLERTINCLNNAADRIETLRDHYDIGHIHIAWLGDHIEGFVSQGGNNAWRTPLSLNEQIRITRRVMLHALLTFGYSAERVSMAAVPGNHGEAVRFGAKGITKYDDSHDTESLIAVSEAAELSDRFGHVRFYVPDSDELTVVLDIAGTRVAHAHGHQWKTNQHFNWWKGQAFNTKSAMHDADLLIAGHTHHEFVDTDGPRKFIQVPALESESTWYRHQKGTDGNPGIVLAITKDGATDHTEIIRG